MEKIEVLKQRVKRNSEMAESIIKSWYETNSYLEVDIDDIGTTEKLLKFIHRQELICRDLVADLPESESIAICMVIYAELVYGKYKKYHKKGMLHLNAAEAIRILQYGANSERESQMFLPVRMIEVLRRIELILNAKGLAQMVDAGVLNENDRISVRGGEFSVSGKDVFVIQQYMQHISGKGMRFRIAKSTRALLYGKLWKQSVVENKFVEGIQMLLSGTACGKDIPIFAGTYYEFLPSVSEFDDTYKLFLKELLVRVDFFIKMEVYLLQQYCKLYSGKEDTQETLDMFMNHAVIVPVNMVKTCMVFTPEWKRWNFSKEKDVLMNPIIRNCEGVYMTDHAICGDALNSWIESTIYSDAKTVAWKARMCQAIEQFFEDEVREYMRKQKFIAGQIEQNGKWHINNEGGIEKLNIVLPGEVDVFAINDDKKVAYLIECKCLQDILTASGNVYQKLKSVRGKLAGTYVQKLKKKREVIKAYIDTCLPEYELITVIVTDIDFPVYSMERDARPWEEIISICDFEKLKVAIKNGRCPESVMEHAEQ